MVKELSSHPKAVKSRSWRQRHPSRQRLERIAWKTRAMMALGGKCERCGTNDSRVLQLDHVDGGGWKNRKEQLASHTKRLLVTVFEQPGLFQLLCANCNWIKRFENDELGQYWRMRVKGV